MNKTPQVDALQAAFHSVLMFLFGIAGAGTAFDPLILLLLALILDIGAGAAVNRWRLSWHPLNVIGSIANWCDRKLNRAHRPEMDRTIRGLIAMLLLVATAATIGWLIAWASLSVPLMWILETALILMLLDQSGVHARVRRAALAIGVNDTDKARQEIAPIASGDTESMDAHAVARAGLEGCGRALAAGVVAPVFWYALFGFPGLLVFRLVSEMDRIIGHRTQEYVAFGFAPAHTNHILLYLPARIAGLLVFIASLFVPTTSPRAALNTMLHEAAQFRSSNLHWPVGAMAGALGIALGGNSVGNGTATGRPWLGAGSPRVTGLDLRRGIYLFAVACLLNSAWLAMLLAVRLIQGSTT
ncbi:MAG: cobalamin biosynthesis protein [Pseudomonadota bacterium]|nr:cobalamin biosynthesis protein [Pseudomonadota bacterium]